MQPTISTALFKVLNKVLIVHVGKTVNVILLGTWNLNVWCWKLCEETCVYNFGVWRSVQSHVWWPVCDEMVPHFGFLYSLVTANLNNKWGDLEHDRWFDGRFSMLLEYESSFWLKSWNKLGTCCKGIESKPLNEHSVFEDNVPFYWFLWWD